MKVLFEVAKDLLKFVFEDGFGFLEKTDSAVENNDTPVAKSDVSIGKTDHVIQVDTYRPWSPVSAAGQRLFVCEAEAALCTSPNLTFDCVLSKVPYGTELTLIRTQLDWFEVSLDGMVGWIRSASVSAETIYPKFVNGNVYSSENTETKKLRTLIKDEFAGALNHSDLLDVEYVTYRLQQKGNKIDWDKKRPRVAGSWHRRLRGRSGILINVTPKTGAVMEVINDEETGQVLFVDAVFPDESILVSGVSSKGTGKYVENSLPKSDWLELRPVFIFVN